MFSSTLPSKSKMMNWTGTSNCSNIGGRSTCFSTFSGLPVKANVLAVLRKNTSSPNSFPEDHQVMKHDLDTTSAAGRKIVHPLHALPTPVPVTSTRTTSAAKEKNQKFIDWESTQLELFVGGRLVQDGLVFRQNFLVRSFEIGGDGNMSLAALMNHLQDTSLNHFRLTGTMTNGYGSIKKMSQSNFISVVSSLHIEVDRYPSWSDLVQVDTWIYPCGRKGVTRDWLFRDSKTGQTLLRATCLYVIMNKKTRKFSILPKEAREEIAPHLVDCDGPLIKKDCRKILPLDASTADHVCTGLTPGWKDMDMNQHVSNIKYIDWVLESIPRPFMEHYDLNAMLLEYRKECDMESVLQSLSKMITNGGTSDHLSSVNKDLIEFDHLLRLEDGSKILRGRTSWKLKDANNHSIH